MVRAFISDFYRIMGNKTDLLPTEKLQTRVLCSALDPAMEALRQRYARGEITKEQFDQMARDLQSHRY